jgi:hypothetical protein
VSAIEDLVRITVHILQDGEQSERVVQFDLHYSDVARLADEMVLASSNAEAMSSKSKSR